jgi:hypothetical protein
LFHGHALIDALARLQCHTPSISLTGALSLVQEDRPEVFELTDKRLRPLWFKVSVLGCPDTLRAQAWIWVSPSASPSNITECIFLIEYH